MRLSRSGLYHILLTGVAEIVFGRRHPKFGWADNRRMLCTLDRKLLNSMPGRLTLNFRVPTHPPAYDARAYNLVCAWDIMWSDYRMIPVENTNVVAVMPTRTKAEQDAFWKEFSARFYTMTTKEKIMYMQR